MSNKSNSLIYKVVSTLQEQLEKNAITEDVKVLANQECFSVISEVQDEDLKSVFTLELKEEADGVEIYTGEKLLASVTNN